VEDALANGRQLYSLTIADVSRRECPHIEVDTSLPGPRVVQVLEKLSNKRQLPQQRLLDNEPDRLPGSGLVGYQLRGAHCLYCPGKPHIESFNGRFRDKCLNAHYFLSVLVVPELSRMDARWIIEACRSTIINIVCIFFWEKPTDGVLRTG
jgi:putative transposase